MSFSAIPLAFFAGVLSLLSPCVLPMLPAVSAAAMRSSIWGLWVLAAGLCLSFALAGSVLTFMLLNAGLSPDVLRYASAWLLMLMGGVLLSSRLSDLLSQGLSRVLSRIPLPTLNGDNLYFQFLLGLSLGLVWLPCVGPTLGTAIALASTGQSLPMAFMVMLSFGVGTALPLVAMGYWVGQRLQNLTQLARISKGILGLALLMVALFIFTGIDRVLEVWAMQILPSWIIDI